MTTIRDDGNGLRVDEDRFTPPAILAVAFVISMVLWGLMVYLILGALHTLGLA